MKHLQLFEEQSINPPILSVFTDINDFLAFLKLYPQIESIMEESGRYPFILPRVNMRNPWTGDKIFCIYAPMNGIDTLVTYKLEKDSPETIWELSGFGERWEEEYYKGQDTKGSFWELANSPEYQDLYVKIAVDLIKKGNLRKYLDIFSGFLIKDLDLRIQDMAKSQGLDTEDFERKIKGAKLLMRK